MLHRASDSGKQDTVVVSYGQGVDSSGILAGLGHSEEIQAYFADQRIIVATADLGTELPETQEFFTSYMLPFLDGLGLPVAVLTPQVRDRHGQVHSNLYDYYLNQAALPSRTRRSCTERFKINTVWEWLDREYPSASVVIGFDCEETGRAKKLPPKRPFLLPLIDLGYNRLQAAQLILDVGLPVPRRSACFCCSFSRSQDWWELSWRHPDLYAMASALEETVRRERRRGFYFRGDRPLSETVKPRRFKVPAAGHRLYDLASQKLAFLTPVWQSWALCLAAEELWGERWTYELAALKLGPRPLLDPWQIFTRLMYCLEVPEATQQDWDGHYMQAALPIELAFNFSEGHAL